MNRAEAAEQLTRLFGEMRDQAQVVTLEASLMGRRWPDHPGPKNTEAAGKRLATMLDRGAGIVAALVGADSGPIKVGDA